MHIKNNFHIVNPYGGMHDSLSCAVKIMINSKMRTFNYGNMKKIHNDFLFDIKVILILFSCTY